MTADSLPPDASDDPEARSPADAGELTPPEVLGAGSGRRRGWLYALLGFLIGGGVLAGLLLVPLSQYAFSPGSVTSTERHITVSGAKSYPSRGDINFLTVSIARATPMTWIRSHFDSSIELISREEAYPSGNRRKEEAVNQRAMDDSKTVASTVALEQLGYTVPRTGTGAFIESVGRRTPAAAARLVRGDVITAVDGQKVELVDDLTSKLATRAAGSSVVLDVRSQRGTTRQVTVTLAQHPEHPDQGYLGVVVSTADEQVHPPVDVSIDSGDVIGPSAGLAFTLGVIDRLTPGDLTGGREVAVTGTIAPDGTVGPIGGIEQKIVAAREAGASVFIYPKATTAKEVRRVRAVAGKTIALKPVANIGEAVAVLAPGGLPDLGGG